MSLSPGQRSAPITIHYTTTDTGIHYQTIGKTRHRLALVKEQWCLLLSHRQIVVGWYGLGYGAVVSREWREEGLFPATGDHFTDGSMYDEAKIRTERGDGRLLYRLHVSPVGRQIYPQHTMRIVQEAHLRDKERALQLCYRLRAAENVRR